MADTSNVWNPFIPRREIIRSLYRNFACCVGAGDILFELKTGRGVLCQQCFLTEEQNRGIKWILFSYPEDPDDADALALSSHTDCYIEDPAT